MDLMDICRQDYQDYVRQAPIHSELKRALKTHERVPGFIDNLARELRKAKQELKRETIRAAVWDLSAIFVQLVQRQAEEKLLSPLALSTMRKKTEDAERVKAASAIMEEKGADYVLDKKNEDAVEKEIEQSIKLTRETDQRTLPLE